MPESMTLSASMQAIIKTINFIGEFVYSKTKTEITSWKTDEQIRNLYQKISNVVYVKTIWQVDKAIDLMEFYCDTYVNINGKNVLINKVDDFNINGNILINGVAGQGKSIFLRYLCMTHLLRGDIIPLFIELRKIGDKKHLIDEISRSLSELGFSQSIDLFEHLAMSGKIVMFLDGFDEVNDRRVSDLVTELEYFSKKYPSLKMIITSRPGKTIENIPFFIKTVMNFLGMYESAKLIKKLSHDEVYANKIIDTVKKDSSGVGSFINTPLSVTLLVVVYKSYQYIPASLAEFYDELFSVLLIRHDGSKPGYTRKRKTKIDDVSFRNAFDAFCVYAKNYRRNIYSQSDAFKCARKSLETILSNEKPHDFIEDIISITCLILKEGSDYKFIHKTTQEYFAASYIKKLNEQNLLKFYDKLSNSNIFNWENEIHFL